MSQASTTARSTSVTSTSESAKPYRGRRMSWEEFYALRPDLLADNDNEQRTEEAARAPLCARESKLSARPFD